MCVLLGFRVFVCSNRRQCGGGYPLKIKLGESPSAVSQEESELQPQLLLSLLKKIDWQALVQTAAEVRVHSNP